MRRATALAGAMMAACLLAGPAAADPGRHGRGHGYGTEVVGDGPVYADGGADVFFAPMPSAPAAAPAGPGLACNRDVVGALLGGAAGGLIGNRFGDGAGRTMATIGGAVLGALAGGSLGRSIDGADQACVGRAIRRGAPMR
ncbi:glycine zipper 2TM domain-containing protein [Azospirillum sp. ST 5-10]|uniref:glycine zipper 2TM domain-containing protein n=1 Tax=unclassified Azospirillum TaxID=2630922 RepID=UPI003F49B9FE